MRSKFDTSLEFGAHFVCISCRLQWFEDRQQQLETLEAQLRRLQASLEGLYSHRRELAYSTAALGRGLALLSNGEDHTGLLRTLAKMAELQDKVEIEVFYKISAQLFIRYFVTPLAPLLYYSFWRALVGSGASRASQFGFLHLA